MQIITLILLLFSSAGAAPCPGLTDYTTPTPTCRATCPSNSLLIASRCLAANQYLLDDQVHLCPGITDGTLCCPRGQAIRNTSSVGKRCGRCPGRMYGGLCCPGSQYVDWTAGGRCVGLGRGACAGLGLRSEFKVCCALGQYYNVGEGRCTATGGNSCDDRLRVCCSAGQKLEYMEGDYHCVSQCNWADSAGLLCRKKYCNSNNNAIPANPFAYTDPSLPLSLAQGCCYGLTPNNTCLADPALCLKQFTNRGWSMCCAAGQFYSPRSNTCSPACAGPIYLQFFCMSNSTYLDLRNPTPSQLPFTTLCNNKRVPEQQPFCCPLGFYINDTSGCRLCLGRIYKSSTSMICCGDDQFYNSDSDSCSRCEGGRVNNQGTLCCRWGQYFGYSAQGVPSCVDTCNQDNLYLSEYCCQALTASQCSTRNLQPTTCNPAYFIESVCQACPVFCPFAGTQAQQCTPTGLIDTCRKQCTSGTVYSPQLQYCLSCDTSCAECSQPMDATACTICNSGFTMLQGRCQRCMPQCGACLSAINNCTACVLDSSRPILANNRCIPYCGLGRYFDFGTASCTQCHPSCLQCTGALASQCSKCPLSYYLSSSQCLPCSPNCLTCLFSPTRCFQCRPPFALDPATLQCLQACPSTTMANAEPVLGHDVCVVCHQSCSTCARERQNCLSCSDEMKYVGDELGVGLCYACVGPCVRCRGLRECVSCEQGYYLDSSAGTSNSSNCLKCPATCRSCLSPSQCLSCIGQSQLVSGQCLACSPSCLSCSPTNTCLACTSPLLIYNGNCLSECPPRTYPLAQARACGDCLVNCSGCVDGGSCRGCARGWDLEWQGLCLRQCVEGWLRVGTSCVRVDGGNGTNNNTNNNTNNSTNNNTNNSTNNNTNNSTNNSTGNVTTSFTILAQSLQPQPPGQPLLITTTLSRPSALSFALLDTQTSTRVPLTSRLLPTTSLAAPNSTTTVVSHLVWLPQGTSLRNSVLLTSDNPSRQSYINSRSRLDLLLLAYTGDPLASLQYIGLAFFILVFMYSLASKLKSHFLAEQSNTLLLHLLNFTQVVHLFKYTRVQSEGMYHLLDGFGYGHVLFWPNFIEGLVGGYQAYPAERALVPDGNFLRQAGSSVSFLSVCVLGVGLAALGSYLVYRWRKLNSMPQIRKIMRMGCLISQLTFMNIVFWALVQLIQPAMGDPGLEYRSRVVAVLMLLVVVVLMLLICYHFYQTYNSDVLEHYATLREAGHYLLTFAQALLLALCVNKPLLALLLVPLEAAHLCFTYVLYRYAEGDPLSAHLKFHISTAVVGVAYVVLAVVEDWVAVVVVLAVAVLVLLTYGTYQIVGLYYGGAKQGGIQKEIEGQQ